MQVMCNDGGFYMEELAIEGDGAFQVVNRLRAVEIPNVLRDEGAAALCETEGVLGLWPNG